MWIRRATSAHRCVCVQFKGVPHHICVSAHVNASRHNQFYARLVLQKSNATCHVWICRATSAHRCVSVPHDVVQPILLGVTFSKAQSSKLERLFCHVSAKRDVRALSFELWNSIRKCHPKWDWLYISTYMCDHVWLRRANKSYAILVLQKSSVLYHMWMRRATSAHRCVNVPDKVVHPHICESPRMCVTHSTSPWMCVTHMSPHMRVCVPDTSQSCTCNNL